jgi:hypothetical protein
LVATAKSPLGTTLITFNGVVRWFVNVTVLAILVLPTVVLPNVNVAGEIVTGEEPVPTRLTICGLFAALSVKVNAPLRAPVSVGENVALTLHVPSGGTLVPQVLLAIEKSPLGETLRDVSIVFC